MNLAYRYQLGDTFIYRAILRTQGMRHTLLDIVTGCRLDTSRTMSEFLKSSEKDGDAERKEVLEQAEYVAGRG